MANTKDYIVFVATTNDCVCLYCGMRYNINIPIQPKLFAAIIDAFTAMHQDCPRHLANLPSQAAGVHLSLIRAVLEQEKTQ